MEPSPGSAIGGVNDRFSRYIDSALFLMWIRRFVSMAGCTKHSPHILLVDGDESHKTLEVIDFAKEHGVILVTFPPHCTHRLHPLDRSFFKSLTTSYSRECTKWLVSHRERAITQFEVLPLFCEAYSATSTVHSAVNGFLASGTWPFKDTTFVHEFVLLEAAAANHDQVRVAADQPCAAVIDPDATAEQQAAFVKNPEAIARESTAVVYQARMMILECSPSVAKLDQPDNENPQVASSPHHPTKDVGTEKGGEREAVKNEGVEKQKESCQNKLAAGYVLGPSRITFRKIIKQKTPTDDTSEKESHCLLCNEPFWKQ